MHVKKCRHRARRPRSCTLSAARPPYVSERAEVAVGEETTPVRSVRELAGCTKSGGLLFISHVPQRCSGPHDQPRVGESAARISLGEAESCSESGRGRVERDVLTRSLDSFHGREESKGNRPVEKDERCPPRCFVLLGVDRRTAYFRARSTSARRFSNEPRRNFSRSRRHADSSMRDSGTALLLTSSSISSGLRSPPNWLTPTSMAARTRFTG